MVAAIIPAPSSEAIARDALARNALAARIHAAKEARRPLIMGILNVTPDSFSDGGQFDTLATGLAHADALIADKCDLIDIGGESTRPGATPVPAEVERARVEPVVDSLVRQGRVPVSVDTSKASVAQAALGSGAAMINDVWGLQADPAIAHVIAQAQGCAVIMHNRREIDPDIAIMDDIQRFFDRSLEIAERAGIARDKITLDPGIGFGKTQAQNLSALKHLDVLHAYGLPVLLGVSRKSMFGHVLGRAVDQRLAGTLATGIYGMACGVAILRVHDVAAHVDALAMHAAIEGAL